MFRFLINLFNIGKRKSDGKQRYWEDNTEIVVDKINGSMTVRTNRQLSEEEIIDYFKKYILGED